MAIRRRQQVEVALLTKAVATEDTPALRRPSEVSGKHAGDIAPLPPMSLMAYISSQLLMDATFFSRAVAGQASEYYAAQWAVAHQVAENP